MATTSSTPALRIARLLKEGARILAVHPGQAGIDISHDLITLLEAADGDSESSKPDEETEATVAENHQVSGSNAAHP